MKAPRLVSALGSAVLFAALGLAADHAGKYLPSAIPPVLRYSEPPDNVIVTLPGPAPEPVPPAAAAVNAPRAKDVEYARPFLRRVQREYPPGFEEDSAKFLQRKIGEWSEFDAPGLLGQPLRRRPSFDGTGNRNGVIDAFADPAGRYREVELDFAGDTGALRTVFLYPVKMTWQECRRTYGAAVTKADAPGGRSLYSYLTRRMDVLVDAAGNVVSLGLY